jgi:hypothetical protein
MKRGGMSPNSVTYTCLIAACALMEDESTGAKLHQDIVAKQIELTIPLYTALINMYRKCKNARAALSLFGNRLIVNPYFLQTR